MNTSLRAPDICTRLQALGDRARVPVLQKFFKTAPGEYGEGDVFVGLRVPEIRKLAKEYQALPFVEIIQLLHSSIHEARLLALLILVRVLAAVKKSQKRRCCPLGVCDLGAGVHGRHLFQRAESSLAA